MNCLQDKVIKLIIIIIPKGILRIINNNKMILNNYKIMNFNKYRKKNKKKKINKVMINKVKMKNKN